MRVPIVPAVLLGLLLLRPLFAHAGPGDLASAFSGLGPDGTYGRAVLVGEADSVSAPTRIEDDGVSYLRLESRESISIRRVVVVR